jgi:hypothetical protein
MVSHFYIRSESGEPRPSGGRTYNVGDARSSFFDRYAACPNSTGGAFFPQQR